MQRFYLKKKLQKIEIFTDDKFHQLSRVLRSKIGDEVILFSDDSGEWVYEISNFSKKAIELVQKKQIQRENPENSCEITLFQSLPNKLEKIEWILEKNIEIGVKKFVFFRSERSQKLFLSDSKKQRLCEIAREALEQCGGITFPEIIFSDEKFAKILEQKSENNILLHTKGEIQNCSHFKKFAKIWLWIWPEGWWSDDEICKMNENQFITARFWNRILRTETAGMAVSFGILHT